MMLGITIAFIFISIGLFLILNTKFYKIPAPSQLLQKTNVQFYQDKIIINGEFEFTSVSVAGNSSMKPAISETSTLILKKYVPSMQLHEGDIIIFKTVNFPNGVAHRISGFSNGLILTKGDNNDFFDAYQIYPENITYIVVGVLYT